MTAGVQLALPTCALPGCRSLVDVPGDVCPSDAYPTQYRPSFRAALDYADRHARSHGIREVTR